MRLPQLSSIRPSRPLLVLGVVLLTSSLALAFLGGATVFLATFTGVPDGPGSGRSFPAETGTVLTWTETGAPFQVVSPNSGVLSEKLLLTDFGGDPDSDFGVFCGPTSKPKNGVGISFDIRMLSKGTAFSISVVDVTGVDISRMTMKGDGSLDVDGKQHTVGSVPNMDYRVNVFLTPMSSGPGRWLVAISKVSDGTLLGTWAGALTGGYQPPAAVAFLKLGGSPGAVVLDNLQIDSLK